jgi:hypothetical protein
MPRLIDDLRVAPKLEMPRFVAAYRESDWGAHARRTIELLREPLPVILIDNVARFYYETSDQEVWSFNKDFPNIAPPFAAFWMEHKLATRIHSKQCGDSDISHLGISRGRIGVLFLAGLAKDAVGEDIPAGAHWVMVAELFVDYGQHGAAIQGPHGTIATAIDEAGALLGAPSMHSWATPQEEGLMKALMTWLHPSLLAISFLHCHNVVQQDERMPLPLAKKYHERTGHWPVKYKTLVIEPLKQILRREGRSGEVGLAKALHICRGHFRDYRQGAGLFGKYHQLVWTPMTTRGTKARGEVPPRDYEVKV